MEATEPGETQTHERIDNATWGDIRGRDIQEAVDCAFLEVVRWRRNLFKLPTGKAGEDFIEELTKMLDRFASGTVFEPFALTLASIMFPLLLQKPSINSKTRDHVRYLEKRLVLWKSGKLTDLLDEDELSRRGFQERRSHTI